MKTLTLTFNTDQERAKFEALARHVQASDATLPAFEAQKLCRSLRECSLPPAPTELKPRFVWLIGSIREEYPDLPDFADGAVRLWDRKHKQAVMHVTHAYAQAICLEHRDHGMPFTELENWFNGLDTASLKSEGLPT